MKSRRSVAVRLAASAALAAVVTLGTHAFVPAAFGCSQTGGSTCREAQPKAALTISTRYFEVRMLLTAIDFLLP